MNAYPLRDNLKALGEIFRRNGFSLFVVGGAVRDHLLGKTNDDVDLTTDASPSDMLGMFPKCIPTGIRHGTLTIPFRMCHYECTTFRIDGDYEDSRHPDSVDFTKDVHEDLKRRDFTINAMCADCVTGAITDDFDGIGDMRRRIIRTVGNPMERFSEDALRLMRAVRFASRLDFDIDGETFEAMGKLAGTITNISAERINSEFSKMLECDHAGKALDLLCESGLLGFIMPEISHLRDSRSRLLGKERMLSDNSIESARVEIRMALLLSDLSSETAANILKRLKFSNSEIRTVSLFVANKLSDRRYSCVELKRIARLIGRNLMETYLGFNGILLGGCRNFKDSESCIRSFTDANEAIDLSDLCISGKDVMSMGLKGREVGAALEMALEIAYDDPAINNDRNRFLASLESRIRHTSK